MASREGAVVEGVVSLLVRINSLHVYAWFEKIKISLFDIALHVVYRPMYTLDILKRKKSHLWTLEVIGD